MLTVWFWLIFWTQGGQWWLLCLSAGSSSSHYSSEAHSRVVMRKAANLTPSYYHLFPYMKKYLHGRTFKNDEETKDAILDALKGFSPAFYRKSIAALHKHLEKCGDYVEKQTNHILYLCLILSLFGWATNFLNFLCIGNEFFFFN